MRRMSEDLPAAGPVSCPNCAAPMASVTHGPTTFDQCNDCGGLWFDLLEHRHLRDEDPHAADIDVKPAAAISADEQLHAPLRTCPRCHVKMTRLKDADRRDVIYDYCAVCNGTFFDAGEFKRYASKASILGGLFGKLGL